jgi:Na+/H+ antiporter NhaD/arsenite permease-like protein
MVSAPYAVISLAIALVVLRWNFRRSLPWKQGPREIEALAAKIAEFDPWALVEDRRVLLRSGAILLLTVAGFAFAQQLRLGMDFIAMGGGTAALLFAGRGVEDAIGKVNWTVILFFMGLFLIIGCVEATGSLEWLAGSLVERFEGNVPALVALLTAFSAVASAIVDNIPVAATLIPVVRQIGGTGIQAEPLWWSLVLGCNLGGNGTPIGSIASVIVLYTLKKEENISVGWGEFIRLGGTIMVIQIAGAITYLLALSAADLMPSF